MSDLVGNPEDRFSHNEAHLLVSSRENKLFYANNKGTDQPVHPFSLSSTFTVLCLDSIISKLTSGPKVIKLFHAQRNWVELLIPRKYENSPNQRNFQG